MKSGGEIKLTLRKTSRSLGLFMMLATSLFLFNGCAPQASIPEPVPGVSEPSQNMGGFVPLAEVPEDYPFDMAVSRGDVVNLHGELSNREAYEKFISTLQKEEPTFMRFVAYTIEGDPILADVLYEDNQFHVTYDVSRDAFAGGIDKVMSYVYEAYEVLDDGTVKLYQPASEQPVPQMEAPETMILPLGF